MNDSQSYHAHRDLKNRSGCYLTLAENHKLDEHTHGQGQYCMSQNQVHYDWRTPNGRVEKLAKNDPEKATSAGEIRSWLVLTISAKME